MGTRAGIYCRISSDRDDTQLGVERQEQDCRDLCARKGWEVADTYVDNDVSAADPRKVRPEYQRLLKDITNRNLDAVVVWDEDRLHRQPAELESFVQACDLAGMSRLASVGGDVDLNDDGALFMLRIKGAMAAQEVAKTRKRLKRQKIQHAESGKYSGGVRPFGYESDGVTIRETEAALIREAASRILEGGTLYAIRKDWRERGITTATGLPEWSTAALKRMLCAPRVAGLRQHQGDVVGEAEWGAILDRTSWEQIVRILTAPSRRQAPPSRDYPLRGVLKCAECGSWLTAMPRKGTRLYGCRKDTGGCGHVMVTGEHIEKHVFDIVVPLADQKDIREALRAEESQEADQARALVAENAKDEAMLAELATMLADGELPRPDYLRQAKRLQDRVDGRESALALLRGSSALDRLGGQVRDSWEALGADDKRLILQSLISEILVTMARRRGSNIFDPTRIDIRWRYEAIEDRVRVNVGDTYRWAKPPTPEAVKRAKGRIAELPGSRNRS